MASRRATRREGRAVSPEGFSSQSRFGEVSDLIFRVSFSLIFIVAGLGHFFRLDLMLERLADSPWYELVSSFGSPVLLLYATGVALVAGGVALLLGYRVRPAAILLLVTLVPITVSIHFDPGHVGPLLKNVALAGGLVHFAVRGPGAYALGR